MTGVFASPHRRAQQTAAPLATALGVPTVAIDGLREVEAGGLERAGDGAAVETYSQTTFSWAGVNSACACLPVWTGTRFSLASTAP